MTVRNPTTRGFTLIEIAVVLVLVALLVSAVAVSSRGILGGATREGALSQIASFDFESRALAKRLGKTLELHVNTNEKRLVLRESGLADTAQLRSYTIPAGIELVDPWRLSRGERIQQDDLVVRYGTDGTSVTWGLSLQSAGQGKKVTDAVMVLGMTGQFTTWESDGQTQDILAAVLRRDAD